MELSLEKILKIILKNIVVLVLATLLCGIGAFLVTKFLIPRTYVSRISFTVISTASETNVANPSYLNSNLNYTRSIVSSKVRMLDVPDYYNMVAAQLENDIDKLIEANPQAASELEQSKKNAAQIASAISFTLIDETELFAVNVRTNSASESKLIADAVGKTANARLTQLAMPENSLAGETPVTDTVRCYENPQMGAFAGPNILMNTFAGCFVGFAITFIIILIITLTDTRIKGLAELNEKYKDIPVLGTVASFKTSKK